MRRHRGTRARSLGSSPDGFALEGKPTRELTRDEKIALVDKAIDRDAQTWKEHVRDNESGLADFVSRLQDNMILYPRMR